MTTNNTNSVHEEKETTTNSTYEPNLDTTDKVDTTPVQQSQGSADPEEPEGVPVYRPIEELEIEPLGDQLSSAPLLELIELSKSYSGGHFAVKDANLAIYPGRIVGLLGPNGSGKTTIIKMISGILVPTHGKVLVNGMEPGVETKKVVSYLPERTYLDEQMKAVEAVQYFEDFYQDFDSVRAMEMLTQLGINPQDKIKSMSKGTKEKVQLILVMSRRAMLYLLDEPIGGVDPAARDYILNTILSNYSPESTVILSTHLIHDIEPILDDVVFLNQGEIALTSSVDDVRQNHGKSVDELFREVFRC